MDSHRDPPSHPLTDWLAIALKDLPQESGADSPGTIPRDLVARYRRAEHCLQLLTAAGPVQAAIADRGVTDSSGADARRTIGRFQIVQELGRGGHGIVFLALDPVLKREVALKVPRIETLEADDLRVRFLREARTVANLNHPNLVQVFEVGEAGPVSYVAQHCCNGPTLSEWMKQQDQPASFPVAAGLVGALAEAVEYVHGFGVVHRDIKPGNVLLEPLPRPALQRDDALPSESIPWTPRLTDFGLARLDQEPRGTRTGAVLGTPAYMETEKATGASKQNGPATYAYALGGILSALLTGPPPVGRASEHETRCRVADGQIIPPRRLRPDLPRDLETICLKCLELRHGNRYPSAGSLASDLERYLRGDTISARRVGPVNRFIRWSMRKPVVAGLTTALAFSVVLGLVGTMTLWRSAESHRKQSDAEFRRAHQAVQVIHDVVFSDSVDTQETLPFRRSLMEAALGYQREFFAQHPDDPGVAADLADALYQLGFASQSLGDNHTALQHYGEAIPLWQSLRRAQPENPEYAYFLVHTYHHHGQVLHRANRLNEARRQYERSLEICEQLLETAPGDSRFVTQSANVCREMASVTKATGDYDAAERWLLREWEIREQLLVDEPESAESNRHIATLAASIGSLRRRQGRSAEAVDAFERAIGLLREIQKQGDDSWASYELALAHQALGRTLAEAAEHDDALHHYQSADKLLDALVTEYPENDAYLLRRSRNQYWIGKSLIRQGREAEALAEFEKAAAFCERLLSRAPSHARVRRTLDAVRRQISALTASRNDV